MMEDELVLFQRQYSDEAACIELLHRLKWPAGFRCPRCDHNSAYTINTRRLPLYECSGCKHQTSLTSGTVLDKSKTPLNKWLCTMYLVAACKKRMNAVTLAELISVSYKTAWSMLGKIRRAISDMDCTILLSGKVEVKPAIYSLKLYQTVEKQQAERAVIVARSTSLADVPYYKIKFASSKQEPRKLLTQEAEEEFLATHVNENVNNLVIHRRPAFGLVDHSPLKQFAKAAFNWINVSFYGLPSSSAQPYLDEFCFRQNTKHMSPLYAMETLLNLCLKQDQAMYQQQNNPYQQAV
jgi:transposase-like protein